MLRSLCIQLGLLGLAICVTMSAAQQPDNLTDITWDHAVNSQHLLDLALASSVQFIEADIVLGSLYDDPDETQMPVMGHPPAVLSDITLHSFLNQVLDFNTRNPNAQKGVKLDFKSIEVFRGSETMLRSLWDQMDYPVWINADILAGPVNNTATTPVDPTEFFRIAQTLPNAVLSIGWTTLWSANHTVGDYSATQVNEMIDTIANNNLTSGQHEITFPVRAGIAANSLDNLNTLLGAVNATHNSTLTVWSSAGDYVNIEALRRLIFAIGLDRVYLDVPEEVSSQLDLGNPGSTAASLVHAGVVTAMMVILSLCLL